jgi:hypothetical protein
MEAPASNPGPKTGYFMFFVIFFRPSSMLWKEALNFVFFAIYNSYHSYMLRSLPVRFSD